MDWNDYFFKLAHAAAEKSKDPSTKIGCILVNKDKRVVSLGFNGFPQGVIDSKERYENRESKYMFIVHAEVNAICSAARDGVSTKNCNIYLDFWPCTECCKQIIQAGIKAVILDGDSDSFNNEELNKRWKDNIEFGKIMLKEAGVEFIVYKREV